MENLSGRVAVVTGAGRGIGRTEALFLAAEGADVVVNDVGGAADGGGANATPAQRVVDEIVAAGGRACVNYDDISDWTGAKSLIDQAVETFGDLNIVVNNAGILRDGMSFSISEEDWDSVIRVHLKGHFATSHFAARYWRERAKSGSETIGRIINTSSDSGLFSNAGQVNYATAKAGIASMTVVLARELEKYGVTVNAIVPRARTRMTEDLGFFGTAPSDDTFDRFAPERVAPVVGWLSTNDASDVNGQILIVNGVELIVLKGYEVAGTADNGSTPWTIDGLAAAKAGLFAQRPSTTPDSVAPNW